MDIFAGQKDQPHIRDTTTHAILSLWYFASEIEIPSAMTTGVKSSN
jgi:hypothetical protein